MHDMSNTRKEIAARLGFAAGNNAKVSFEGSEGNYFVISGYVDNSILGNRTFDTQAEAEHYGKQMLEALKKSNPRAKDVNVQISKVVKYQQQTPFKTLSSRPGAKARFGRFDTEFKFLDFQIMQQPDLAQKNVIVLAEKMGAMSNITKDEMDGLMRAAKWLKMESQVKSAYESARSRMSRPGAKVLFDTYTDMVNELRRLTADSANVQYDWYTAANTWLARKRTSGNKEIAVEANRAYDAVEREMRPKWRQSRPGAKVSFERYEIGDAFKFEDKIYVINSHANEINAMLSSADSNAKKALSLADFAHSKWLQFEGKAKASRPGAKARMTREQSEEQKAGLKIMSAADPAVGAKIAKLIKEGKPQDQAVAIALDMKRRGEL